MTIENIGGTAAQPGLPQLADVPVAILAGGLATRLRPVTDRIPKAMLEVAGKPFVDHQLDLLKRKGIHRVVFCLGHLGEQVENYLGNGARQGMELRYSYDGAKLVGTGGALRRAAPLLGDLFWVLYGDSYADIDYAALLTAFVQHNWLAQMTVIANQNRWDRSNVLFQDGRLDRYDKRNPTSSMEHIDYGVSILRAAALQAIPLDQCYDLADLYHDLVKQGKMGGCEVGQRFYEIGSASGLEEARSYLGRAG